MGVQSCRSADFVRNYGNQPWVDENTVNVVVGDSEQALTEYFHGHGFVEPFGIFGGKRGSLGEFARDTTDYCGLAATAAADTIPEDIDTTWAGEALKGADIGGTLTGYVPNHMKRLGATLPIGDREHARIYRLPDGRYAAEVHKDPGLSDYFGGLLDGDVASAIGGAWRAARYHFIDPQVRDMKYRAVQMLSGMMSGGRNPAQPDILRN